MVQAIDDDFVNYNFQCLTNGMTFKYHQTLSLNCCIAREFSIALKMVFSPVAAHKSPEEIMRHRGNIQNSAEVWKAVLLSLNSDASSIGQNCVNQDLIYGLLQYYEISFIVCDQ